MRPLPPAVTTRTLSSEALETMRRDDADFLPVVAPETEKFLGVVLRSALERGCLGMGHRDTECRVFNHVKADVEFCFEDEPGEPLVNETADLDYSTSRIRKTRTRSRRRLPIIVVDEHKVPVGMIERETE